MNQNTVIHNLYETIESAPIDEAVGIRLVHLTGSEEYSLYAAEIGPKKKVGAHYHEFGIEIYQIIEGEGIMRLGNPNSNGTVEWTASLNVRTGDCFTVDEGEVHQLVNLLDQKLIIVVGCAKSHVTTDRIIVKGAD